MPRSIVLGNDHFHVSFDSDYVLRDIFFPHVGQENHTAGGRCRTGVWFGGKFSWFSDPAWRKDIRYVPDTLVSHVVLTREDWGLTLTFNDVVDLDRSLLVRRVTAKNTGQSAQDLRLYFHYDFDIYGVQVGDTVYYDPFPRALIAYKGRRYFIASASGNGSVGVERFATGIADANGHEGTWRDAEDGHLGCNPVAQGSVDAVIELDLGGLKPKEEKTGYHWLGAGSSRTDIIELDTLVRDRGPENFVTRTRDWWLAWRNCEVINTRDLDGETDGLYERSMLVMRSHIDGGGAVIASTDWDILPYSRDTYCYCWPRDGASVSIALTYAGYLDAPRKFFEYCDIVFRPFDGYFLHKFTPSGEVASTWHPWAEKSGEPRLAVQEDETGIVLHALWEFYRRSHAIEFIRPRYRPLVRSAADWLSNYVDPETGLPKPSYDLWEERWGVHAYTVASAWAGLQAAANFSDLFNQKHFSDAWRGAADKMKKSFIERFWDPSRKAFVRSLVPEKGGKSRADSTIDASTLAVTLLGMLPPDDEKVIATAQAVEKRLWCQTGTGGIARYENDTYHQAVHGDHRVPGNPWVITTMWLAQYKAITASTEADLSAVKRLIKWAERYSTSSGILPEQIHPLTGAPLSVAPLTWSHAEYARAVQEYLAAWERVKLAG
jgi:oligosaccharide amylase